MKVISYLAFIGMPVLCCSLLKSALPTSAASVGDNFDNPSQKQTKTSGGTQSTETPFACNVAALSAAERIRSKDLFERLKKETQEVRELEDGYEIRLPSDSSTVKDVAEWIVYERLCCPFFDFHLKVEREGGPLWLTLTGREGVKEFLRLELQIQ